MLNIYIARHGQDEDNKNGILNGHRDQPLTETGKSQAKWLGKSIADLGLRFESVYSSPLQRAYETAKVISSSTGSPNPQKEQLLIERDFGVMTGQKVADIKKMCAPDIIKSDTITYFLNPEGAETFPDLLERGRRIVEWVKSNHQFGNILLVTHGDIGKMVYYAYYNLSWPDVLIMFHFGNSDLLLVSDESKSHDAHVFQLRQHNL